MCDRVDDFLASLRATVSSIEGLSLTAGEAARLVEVLSEAERLCQAGRTLASRRVLETRAWRAAGYRTPAQWLAERARTTLSRAIAVVETAHRLEDLPATREALVSGRLSDVQVAEIASAATADPSAEVGLLDAADRETVAGLRERCREVRTAAASDEDAAERLRRARYLRHWTDAEGAVRLDARLAPDDGAALVAAVTACAARLQDDALRSGIREPRDAHAADALVELARGGASRAVVHVRVDAAALERGRTEPGETCRIDGVGPVPVATARRLATAGVVKALATEGADVRAVAHLGRTIPARLRTALEARDPACVVPGCEVASGLEIDHILPLARGGPTSLANLARLCRHHHAAKTHRGWRLEGGPGAWRWTRGARPPPRAP